MLLGIQTLDKGSVLVNIYSQLKLQGLHRQNEGNGGKLLGLRQRAAATSELYAA